MGYRLARTTYKLTFPEYDGLEVMARSLSTGDLMKIMELSGALAPGSTQAPVERAKTVESLLRRFAKALVTWNLEDEDGEPIGTTYEDIADQELPFVLRIIEAWTEAVAGVPDDLGKASNSGPQFPEVSIPMASL